MWSSTPRTGGIKEPSNPLTWISIKGRIIGLTGLLGVRPFRTGQGSSMGRISLTAGETDRERQEVKGQRAIDAMMQGMAYLPENRKEEGIIADLSVRENIIIALSGQTGHVQADVQGRSRRRLRTNTSTSSRLRQLTGRRPSSAVRQPAKVILGR